MCVVFTTASPNGLTWYLSLDQFEEEESVVVHDRRLPLYLCSHKISEVKDGYTVSLLYMVVIGEWVLLLCIVVYSPSN